MPENTFEVLIDETLAAVTSLSALKSVLNNHLISIVNDFEDTHWRHENFENFIWDNIAETALSERERQSLSYRSRSTLIAAAKNLRLTDNDKKGEGSEIAEIFLYGVMRHHFGALPAVPKIFYKQNVNDNAKGADSVHIVVKDNDFSLWFGEAKFYNSIEDARLGAVVSSVYSSLAADKLKKERSIVTSVSELDAINIDSKIRDKIKNALKPSDSIDHLKGRLNVPILLLHQCTETNTTIEMSDTYRSFLKDFHTKRAESYFSKQVAQSSQLHKYDIIKFHLILFPVPDKAKIVASFLNEVKFYRKGP